MTDAVLVMRKVTVLREHLERVRRRRPAREKPFVDDVDLQDATAMSLLVAIQEATDLALHLASDEGWGVPGSYAEGFELLATHGVIDEELARALGRMVGLRNRLAHGYTSVDPQRLWAEIPDALDTLDRYVVAIAHFVDQAS
jgi:uncharacterized protein YutE (UPF0331/DUF86 family)